MKRAKRMMILMTAMVMLISIAVVPKSARAYGTIDVGREVTLTLRHVCEAGALTDVRFNIYRVADTDQNARMKLTGEFENYPIDINGLDESGWRWLAYTLASHVQHENIAARDTGLTDENGTLRFPTSGGGAMLPGLYLVMGESRELNGKVYTAAPFVTFLPGTTNDEWAYDVTINTKYDVSDVNYELVMRKVLVVWEDAGYEHMRPEQLVVYLMRDTRAPEAYDVQVLTAEMNWRYTWEELDGSYVYTIAQDPAPHYTTQIEQYGITFLIRNRYVGPTDTPTPTPTDAPITDAPTTAPVTDVPTDAPVTDGPTTAPVTDVPVTDAPTTAPITDDPTPTAAPTDVPQPSPTPKPPIINTGMLWWPVPVLLIVGVSLVLFGIARRRREDA